MLHTTDKNNERYASTVPGWWIVAKKELRELWIGGRVPMLMIMFSIALGILVFLLATNRELSLVPPRDMVMLVLKTTMFFTLFIGLVIGADSISGEREKGTLEGLLLTPISRRSIVFGKFLAAVSAWPIALIIALPYLFKIAPDFTIFIKALTAFAIIATLLVFTTVGFSVLISIRAKSNRASLSTSLIVFLLVVLPSQLPGTAQTGSVGKLIKHLSPIESTIHFLEKIIVNNRSIAEMSSYLISPIVLFLLVIILLFYYEASSLNFYGGRNTLKKAKFKVGSIVSIVFLLAMVNFWTPYAYAQQTIVSQDLTITVDTYFKVTKTGDRTKFTSNVVYNGNGESLPLVLAMNIVNLENGAPVDPEDWSPVRTQNITSLTSGKSMTHNWEVFSILEGNYLVYLAVIPSPQGTEATTLPVASTAVHLTVKPFARLNPGGVLPIVLGMPMILVLGFYGSHYLRKRKVK